MSPETPFTLLDIVKGIGSALVAVCLYVVGLFRKRLEAVEVAHAQLVSQVMELDLEKVSRDTHQRHEKDMRDQFLELQHKAEGREERILTAIADLGKRIDTLFQERR